MVLYGQLSSKGKEKRRIQMIVHKSEIKTLQLKQAKCRNHRRNAIAVIDSDRFNGNVALCRECLDRFPERPLNIVYLAHKRGLRIMRKREHAFGGWTGWRYALVCDDRFDVDNMTRPAMRNSDDDVEALERAYLSS
jgi:hypothetical protein